MTFTAILISIHNLQYYLLYTYICSMLAEADIQTFSPCFPEQACIPAWGFFLTGHFLFSCVCEGQVKMATATNTNSTITSGNMKKAGGGSNWAKLQVKIATTTATVATAAAAAGAKSSKKSAASGRGQSVPVKVKRTDLSIAAKKLPPGTASVEEGLEEDQDMPFPREFKEGKDNGKSSTPTKLSDLKPPQCTIDWRDRAKFVALDCEMVGIGIDGKTSALARCSIVDFDGKTIFDEHVRPPAFVTDFRTKWSGIRKHDLRQGHAITLQECQTEVAKILKGKMLVGHALKNDLDVLMLSHPRTMIRDTARYKPLMRPHGRKQGKFRPRALRDLTIQHFKIDIQAGEHDSVSNEVFAYSCYPNVCFYGILQSEDARAALYLYRKHRDEWEDSLKRFKNPKLNTQLLFANNTASSGAKGNDDADGGASDIAEEDEIDEEDDEDDDDNDQVDKSNKKRKLSDGANTQEEMESFPRSRPASAAKNMFGEDKNVAKKLKSISDVDKTRGNNHDGGHSAKKRR
jgi:RNA exonuclease 4